MITLRKWIHSWIINFFLIPSCAFITFVSCNSSNKSAIKKELYCYRNTDKNGEFLSRKFKRGNIKKHHDLDILLEESNFIFNGNRHVIRIYTNSFHCPIDGGRLVYELDSLGIFYSKSTSFYDYAVLMSTNDSISKIIERGLENIIFYSEITSKKIFSVVK